MRYSAISAAILALTSSVFAQTANFDPITSPTQDQQVPAGSTLQIVWQPSTVHTGPITIQLLQGATPSTLEIGETITAGLDQTLGKFSWAVPTSLKNFATYGFKITLDSTASSASPIFQFSFPFHITGLSGASSSSQSGGTTTVHLSTGTGYTAQPTTSASANSTSTCTTSTTSEKASTYSASTTPYPSSNVTLSTTLKPTATSASSSVGAVSSTGSSASATSSTPAQTTSNSAVTNMARGGVAVLGGLVLAFAL